MGARALRFLQAEAVLPRHLDASDDSAGNYPQQAAAHLGAGLGSAVADDQGVVSVPVVLEAGVA